MAVPKVAWTAKDEEELGSILKALEEQPQSRLTLMQFKLTVRQILAMESIAEGLALMSTIYAREHAADLLPPTDATRGPGRMRR